MSPEAFSWNTLMPFVIMGLALCLVVGPIMMMRPSRRQSYLAQLRTSAADQQLSVTQAIWPERFSAPLGLMRYGLRQPRLPSQVGAVLWMREDYCHEMHLADYWHCCPIGNGRSVNSDRPEGERSTGPVDTTSENVDVINAAQQQALAHLLAQWNPDSSIKALGIANGSVFLDWVETPQLSVAEIRKRLNQAFCVFNLAP